MEGLSENLENLEFNMANVCEPAFGFVQKMRKEFGTDADLEAFKVEFSRLFVGPYEMLAAPYGSVYLEDGRRMMGDSTLDVKNRYREAGLNTAKTFKDAPDHISARSVPPSSIGTAGTVRDWTTPSRSTVSSASPSWAASPRRASTGSGSTSRQAGIEVPERPRAIVSNNNGTAPDQLREHGIGLLKFWLHIDPDEQALARKTGARALRSIVEESLLDVMYDIPERSDVRKCIITEEVIREGVAIAPSAAG